MSVVAAGLTDQQISDAAAWYASPGSVAAPPQGLDATAAPEICSTCHGADGIALNEDAPNLASENTMYIDPQLKAFRSGKRVHETMTAMAKDLSDEEIHAVSEWYAGIGLEIHSPRRTAGPACSFLVRASGGR